MLLASSRVRQAAPARAPRRKRVLAVDQPGDRHEREADRAADAFVGGSAARFALSSLPVQLVQRQDAGPAPVEEKSEADKYEEAAKKVAKAFAETSQGKSIIAAIEADPLVKAVKDPGEKFLSTKPGKVVAGASVVGAIAALAASHKALPIGVPDIPLEKVSSRLAGWTMHITWEGPVDQPTKAMVAFSFSGSGEKKREPAKKQSEVERLRAENARFRAGMSYMPGSKEATEQAMLEAAAREVASRHSPLGIGGAKSPGAPVRWGPGFMPSTLPANPSEMPRPEAANVEPAPVAGEPEKKEEPVMRKADGLRAGAPAHVSAAVEAAVAGSAQPLDRATRALMESRFGFDFGHVRIHADSTADESARALGAVAYSVGRDVVFSAGAYSPASATGQWLLAHELAHVVQQGGAGDGATAMPVVHRVQRKTGAPPKPDPLGTALRGDDDDARALTKSPGWTALKLEPPDAATLLIHLLKGATWDDDERAGLRILEKMASRAKLDDTLQDLDARRRYAQLLEDYDGSEYGQLLDLLSKNLATVPGKLRLLDEFISMRSLDSREEKAVVVLLERTLPGERIWLLVAGQRVKWLRSRIDDRPLALRFEAAVTGTEAERWRLLSDQLTGIYGKQEELSIASGQRSRAQAESLRQRAVADLSAELAMYQRRVAAARAKGNVKPSDIAAINKELAQRLDRLVGQKKLEFSEELKHDISFDRFHQADAPDDARPWGRVWFAGEGEMPTQEQERIDEILSQIPYDVLHMHPDLKVLARANRNPKRPGVAGVAQEEAGRIQLRGSLSFEVAVHEVGHFVHYSDRQAKGPDTVGNLLREFMRLSMWSYMTDPVLRAAVPNAREHDKLKKSLDAEREKNDKDPNFGGTDHPVGDFVYRFARYSDAPGPYVRRHKSALFITPYAATEPQDDFAESFAYFFVDPERLQKDCPDKYRFMLVRVMTDHRLKKQKEQVLRRLDEILAPSTHTATADRLVKQLRAQHRPALLKELERIGQQMDAQRATEIQRAEQRVRAKPGPIQKQAIAAKLAEPALVVARTLVAAWAPLIARCDKFDMAKIMVEIAVHGSGLDQAFDARARALGADFTIDLMARFEPLARKVLRGEEVKVEPWPELHAMADRYEARLGTVEPYVRPFSASGPLADRFTHHVGSVLDGLPEPRRTRVREKIGPIIVGHRAAVDKWRADVIARVRAGKPFHPRVVKDPTTLRASFERRFTDLVRKTR